MQKTTMILTAAIILTVSSAVPGLAASPQPYSIFLSEMKTVQKSDLTGSVHSIDTETTIPDNVFGHKKGYFHPFISLSVLNSDNIYRTRENTLSDWVATLSPGIWFTIPGSDNVILSVNSENSQPAGLNLFLAQPDGFSRYQAYVLYGADIAYHSDYSERDNTKQAVEVFFQYNLRGGLSLNVYDKWVDSEEFMYTTGISSTFSKFTSNLAGALVSYKITEKLSLRGDFNLFSLDYVNLEDQPKNRRDSAFSLYGLYNYSPKTTLFFEYRNTSIKYDSQILLDSTQHGYYVGIRFLPTVSTKLIAKAGREHKEYDTVGLDSLSGTNFEFQFGHAFSEKSEIAVTGTRKINETLVTGTGYQVRTSVLATHHYRLTERIQNIVNLGYEQNEYVGLTTSELNRTDDIYSYELGLSYSFNSWLTCELFYGYNKRDSTDDIFIYNESTYVIRLSGGM